MSAASPKSEKPSSEARLPSTVDQVTETGGGVPRPVVFVSWPIVDERPRSLLPASAIPAAALVVYLATGHGALAALTAGAMALTLWRLLVPIRYEINFLGITQHVLRRRRHVPWRAMGGYKIRDDGMLVLPRGGASPLGYVRALFVPWGGQREAMLVFARRYLGGATEENSSVARAAEDAADKP